MITGGFSRLAYRPNLLGFEARVDIDGSTSHRFSGFVM